MERMRNFDKIFYSPADSTSARPMPAAVAIMPTAQRFASSGSPMKNTNPNLKPVLDMIPMAIAAGRRFRLLLLATQILWLNQITDSWLALAMAFGIASGRSR